MKKPNILIAAVYNSKGKSKLWCLQQSLTDLMTHGECYDSVVCDDSNDGSKTKNKRLFTDLGCKYLYTDTKGLETIEERITYSKNKLRKYFLDNPQYTHIFYLESDIIVGHHIIRELLSHNVDNITAIRPQQGNIPGVFPYNDLLPRDMWKSRTLPNFRLTSFEEIASYNKPLIEVACYGSGCNLLSRKASEAASYWVKPHSPVTHDITYCMDLYALGFPCYCDTRLICSHYFNPIKHPDERFDYGGDWKNIKDYRKTSVQSKVLDG